jgi:hypothetical protein
MSDLTVNELIIYGALDYEDLQRLNRNEELNRLYLFVTFLPWFHQFLV